MFNEKGTVYAKALRGERAGLVPGTERPSGLSSVGEEENGMR